MTLATVLEVVRSLTRARAEVWPPLRSPPRLSLAELDARFDAAGDVLRQFAGTTSAGAWPVLDRAQVAAELRDRIVDPALVHQRNTGLCGPASIVFELGRREPARLVQAVAELFDTGSWTPAPGRRIQADRDLRSRRLPHPGHRSDGSHGAQIAQVDWMLMATMREDENASEDVEDDHSTFGNAADGWETLSWPTEVKRWVHDILGLRADVDDCWAAGEHHALRAGDEAVRAGGVAILCLDSNALLDGGADDEENVFIDETRHERLGARAPKARVHAVDDGYLPDHYAVLAGPVDWTPGAFRLPLWCWGAEFTITGDPEGFFEYLYNVIIGRR